MFFVIAQGDRINPAKSKNFKVLSCMETGDADPRIHCEFFLEKEGKPLFDIVALFSANLNYNRTTGKVYLHMNPSITSIVQNRDRYIKPLQDMGIKVVLGIMGNGDPAGVAHLERETATYFIQEVKTVMDTYGLDGVFWDDEYTWPDETIPGLSTTNVNNSSRLLFESKRAMPDKLNIIYALGGIESLRGVDNVKPGDYIDYIMADYQNNAGSLTLANWPGTNRKQGMPHPYELVRGLKGDPSLVISGRWGGIMVFGLSEHRNNWSNFGLPSLQHIANTMFEDKLVYTGVSYPVEW